MDKVKEIVKKFGGFIELGGFAFCIIGVFLPFVVASFFGYTASVAFIKATWGVIILIFSILGAAVIAGEMFAKDLYKKIVKDNKTIQLVIDLALLGIAIMTLLVTIIKGSQASSAYTHLGFGFYLLLIGAIVVVAVRVVKCFMIKNISVKISNNQ
ncbi:MAG: hypothetical protein IKR57_01010 [Bacilli bacterium]|nr:hypothetical protein [Bacilli bacterium]